MMNDKKKISTKRILIYAVLLIVAVIVAFGINLTLQVQKEMMSSEAYKVVVEHVSSDSTTLAKIGDVEGFGKIVWGYITPEKSARLVFKVKGTHNDIKVISELLYNDGSWLIEKIEYQ